MGRDRFQQLAFLYWLKERKDLGRPTLWCRDLNHLGN